MFSGFQMRLEGRLQDCLENCEFQSSQNDQRKCKGQKDWTYQASDAWEKRETFNLMTPLQNRRKELLSTMIVEVIEIVLMNCEQEIQGLSLLGTFPFFHQPWHQRKLESWW